MAAGTGEKITVQCNCGAKLKAPASAAGRKAKCPKCGATLTVQAPPPAAEDDGLDALYDLASDAKQAARGAPAEQVAVLCPGCRTRMEAGAVLCTNCGYDTRTGKSLATSTSASSAPPPAAKGTAYAPSLRTSVQTQESSTTGPGEGGNLIKGAVISAIFAFVGALVWYFIAKGTHREIGWIAWGVGVAAGFGMMIGYNGTSVKSGAVAAAMAVGGILLGKFMVFTWVVVPLFAGPQMNEMLDKELAKLSDEDKLQVWVTNQQLEKKGISPADATDEQREAASDEADKIIAKMDAKTKKAETAKAGAALKKFGEEALAEAVDVNESKLFFSTMFDVADIVFIVLAVASAFKVATFGHEVEDD